MLHLFPIRVWATWIALLALGLFAVALEVHWVATDTPTAVINGVFKVVTPATLIAMPLANLIWRLSPGPIQRLLFPHLGGQWVGKIEFIQNGQTERRAAVMMVAHTLLALQIELSTEESSSKTIVVHVRKPATPFERVKLIYIYEVERGEGFENAGDTYRGCAFLDVHLAAEPRMVGSYMAGAGRAGSITMTLQRSTPWWMLTK